MCACKAQSCHTTKIKLHVRNIVIGNLRLFGAAVSIAAGLALPASAQSLHYHYANSGASAHSSSNAFGGGIVSHGLEQSSALAENTSWGTAFGHTALTHSSSFGAGTAFGTGLGAYGFGAGGNANAYTNRGGGTLTFTLMRPPS